ncbi:MAG TPA: hypothetical protein VJQ82_18030 [Terriglobales bacterium]|nr:hypothetical protein [Terriglobales bacterium]
MFQASGGDHNQNSVWQNIAWAIGLIVSSAGAFLHGKRSWISSQKNGRPVSIEETLKASPFLQDMNERLTKLHYENRRVMEDVRDIREAIQRLEER